MSFITYTMLLDDLKKMNGERTSQRARNKWDAYVAEFERWEKKFVEQDYCGSMPVNPYTEFRELSHRCQMLGEKYMKAAPKIDTRGFIYDRFSTREIFIGVGSPCVTIDIPPIPQVIFPEVVFAPVLDLTNYVLVPDEIWEDFFPVSIENDLPFSEVAKETELVSPYEPIFNDTSGMTTRDFVNVMRACGMAASGRRKGYTGTGPGKKKRYKRNGPSRQGQLALQRAIVQTRPAKYLDTQISGNIVLAGSLNQITDTAQGPAQGQRIGDRIMVDHFIWNYTLYQENADIVNTVRLMVVQFEPSTTLVSGAVTDFLQTASPTSLYNHELRRNYFVLYDKVYRMAGIASAPTNTSAIGRNNVIIRPKHRMLDFTLASTTGGVDQCFVLLIGDSIIAPYVTITSTIRMVYRDG